MEINLRAKEINSKGKEWLHEKVVNPLHGIASAAKELIKHPKNDETPKKVIRKSDHAPKTISSPDDVKDITIASSFAAEVLLSSTSSTISSSTIASEESVDQNVTLQILQARNLRMENPQIRICRLDEDERDVIGTLSGTSSDPVWGGSTHAWSILGNEETKVVLLLFGEKEEKCVGRAQVKLFDLLPKFGSNPNRWLYFDNELGQVQIRLSRSRGFARLNPPEKCQNITAGPALGKMAKFTSYAVRKMALYSCAPVTLNVYDVSNNTKIETLNKCTKAVGAGGIFHAAVEIFGKEYSFGGTMQKSRSKISGVFACEPKKCPMHHYRESVYLGDCELTPLQAYRILKDMRPHWLATDYNLFHKNCCFFSREFAIQLGVGDIPEWVYSLATTAEFIEPYFNYLAQRAQARAETAKPTTTPNKLVAVNQQYTPPKPEQQKQPPKRKEHHEAMLDHAMAARIQRSVRTKQHSRRQSISLDC